MAEMGPWASEHYRSVKALLQHPDRRVRMAALYTACSLAGPADGEYFVIRTMKKFKRAPATREKRPLPDIGQPLKLLGRMLESKMRKDRDAAMLAAARLGFRAKPLTDRLVALLEKAYFSMYHTNPMEAETVMAVGRLTPTASKRFFAFVKATKDRKREDHDNEKELAVQEIPPCIGNEQKKRPAYCMTGTKE